MPTSEKLEGEDSWYLSDISLVDKPWDIHRAQSDELAKIYGFIGCSRYAERIGECAEWLIYALQAKDDGEVKLKLSDTRFCRVRHCLICQWRKSLMWRARFFKALPEIQKVFPTARWIFVTLTVKNCELSELRITLNLMNTAWKRLTERKVFPAIGFIKSVEVTKGIKDTAHPHFHCLMLVPAGYFTHSYISHSKWQELWKSCLKIDYTPIIDVRVVKSKTTSSNAMAEAVCETLKYVVKPSDLLADPYWLDELTKQLQKTRTISIGGCLKEYFSDDEPENLINSEIKQNENAEAESFITFDWSTIVQRYKKANDRNLS